MLGPSPLAVRRRDVLRATAAAPAVCGHANAQADPVGDILRERVEIGRDSVGYVAATVDSGNTRLVAAGRSDAVDGRPLDGDTVFEIGSITKVFTALLLADMAQTGDVALTDPVAKYLPPQAQPASFDGKAMTLLDLVTYTSGLPNLPGNFRPKDPGNPYADYTVAQLYEALSTVPARYDPGSHYEYANLGFALLGHVLALRAGRSYEDLIVSRLCGPLGLDDTRVTLTPSMQQRFVPAHDSSLKTIQHWDLPTLAGAGALRSTANDLLRFLDACQGRRATPLAGPLASLLEVRRQTDAPALDAAAGWFVAMRHGDEIVHKDGGTGGHSSFIGYSIRTGRAGVLLANSCCGATILPIGRHLVDPAYPLPVLHRQIPTDPAKLAGLAGRYASAADFVFTVTPRDGRLMVQLNNQPDYEVFPESDSRFFYRIVDAQLSFTVGADGAASALVLHQNGRNRRAVRLP